MTNGVDEKYIHAKTRRMLGMPCSELIMDDGDKCVHIGLFRCPKNSFLNIAKSVATFETRPRNIYKDN